ncbi:MAG: FAD binding domain-containing protein, partial [Chloroflexota bacterium]
MYPAKFDYVRASSVQEAVSLLKENEDAKLLAGGHSLIPAMKLRLAQPPVLIDIGRIDELKSIAQNNGSVKVGALSTHA